MLFNPEKMAFGRHETFALRYGWLSKGFQAVCEDNTIFESADATVRLGVGKNMVTAIRYWLRACSMIDANKNTPTELGTILLSEHGFDPYLEDEGTIWLLHWLLATQAELATSWYWFFNRFHKPEFTGQELTTALNDFVSDKIIHKKKPALATLKNDATLIPRMYSQSLGRSRMALEDVLDSPFSLLQLINQPSGSKGFQSRPMPRPELPIGVLGFAVCQLFKLKNTKAIPIEDFMYSKDNCPAVGSVFRITESDLIAKLEKLVDYTPEKFEIRDTAGHHQLFLIDTVEPLDFIVQHYSDPDEGLAA